MKLIPQIESFISRFVSFADPSYLLPLSLWTIGTHMYRDFDAYPYLVITSATKRSGKTRLSEILSFMCHTPRNSSALTGQVLYRMIETEHPTLIFDEAETLNSESATIQRAVLNVGYRRGQTVPRTAGQTVIHHDTYCPKMFVLIGDVYDTLRDRSIIVQMKRGEPRERFLMSVCEDEGKSIRNTIETEIKKQKNLVGQIYKEHPPLGALTDRDEEIWLPLFSLAKLLCPERIKELLTSAVDISTMKTAKSRRFTTLLRHENTAVNADYAEKLLVDLYGLFTDGSKFIPSGQAIEALKGIPASPWRRFKGIGLTDRDLAKLLKPFIGPTRIVRLGNGRKYKQLRGYRREDVEKAVKEL